MTLENEICDMFLLEALRNLAGILYCQVAAKKKENQLIKLSIERHKILNGQLNYLYFMHY